MNLGERWARLRADPDFALLAACCRPAGYVGRLHTIAHAFDSARDHARFLSLVRAHRVAGLVEQALAAAACRLPEPFQTNLADLAGTSRIKLLRNAGEELRLAEAFEQAGLAAYFVKGATLAQLAHGGLGTKTSWDIDMVTSRTDAIAAAGLLSELGYCCEFGGSAADLSTFIARNYETCWKHAAHGHVVDLHAAIDESPRTSAAFANLADRQLVEIAPGRRVRTLASPDLALYLALHGTKHGWSRLKWLADFAALIDRQGLGQAELRDRAAALSLVPQLDMSLAMVAALFVDTDSIIDAPQLNENQRQIMMLSLGKIMRCGRSIDDRGGRAGWFANHELHIRTSRENGELAAALWRRLMKTPNVRRARLPRWLLPIDALFIWAPLAMLKTLLNALQQREAPEPSEPNVALGR